VRAAENVQTIEFEVFWPVQKSLSPS
jgi:hypothetical protein